MLWCSFYRNLFSIRSLPIVNILIHIQPLEYFQSSLEEPPLFLLIHYHLCLNLIICDNWYIYIYIYIQKEIKKRKRNLPKSKIRLTLSCSSKSIALEPVLMARLNFAALLTTAVSWSVTNSYFSVWWFIAFSLMMRVSISDF